MSGESLKLPTTAVDVELALADGAVMRAQVFVPDKPRIGRTALALDVALLLDSDAPFLPARDGGHVVLYGKRAIAYVAVPLKGPDGGGDTGVTQLYDQAHDVEVVIDGMPTLIGQLLYSSPVDRPRVIDHLNQPGGFVRLWTAETLFVIGKHHVVRVREIG